MQITLEALRAIVGPAHVLTGDDVHSRRVDWMTGAPCQAGGYRTSRRGDACLP